MFSKFPDFSRKIEFPDFYRFSKTRGNPDIALYILRKEKSITLKNMWGLSWKGWVWLKRLSLARTPPFEINIAYVCTLYIIYYLFIFCLIIYHLLLILHVVSWGIDVLGNNANGFSLGKRFRACDRFHSFNLLAKHYTVRFDNLTGSSSSDF